MDEENNYLIVKIKIQDRTLLLGAIYGPNGNNVEFNKGIRWICEAQNIPIILGGDFNTVLDNRDGALLVDRMGERVTVLTF